MLDFFIPRLFADRLSLDGKLKKNRNLFYIVNNEDIVRLIQTKIWEFCDKNDVTFISFNYDGLIEAFLDCDLTANQRREKPLFRYLPEISHGLPFVMPERSITNNDSRDFKRIISEMPSAPKVLKPHGSLHFYSIKQEIASLVNVSSLVALHPRFDIGFDPKTMQRDIPDIPEWEFINPVPFIIPPVINKDSYLSNDYVKAIFSKVVMKTIEADKILSLGFSIPRSDLHVTSLLQIVADNKNRSNVGIVFKRSETDNTIENWERIFGGHSIRFIEDNGFQGNDTRQINAFWDKVNTFVNK